jgi:diguanylate cyclase (GGDEF)-like protein
MIRINTFLAIGYFLGGYLGTLLSIPPSHASPIWPAAGIALAGFIVYGYRAIPGIWLGAFFTQAYAFWDMSSLQNMPGTLFIGVVASTAATLQAGLGSGLVKRYVGGDNALLSDNSILTFLALGGPLSCLVSASVGILTLYLREVVSFDNMSSGWMAWWVGDTIGVLIFTPLLLCFIGKPRTPWRSRINPVAVPLMIISLLVMILFQFGKGQEQRRISTLFAERVSLLHNALQNEFHSHIEVNNTLQAFFNGSANITADEFKQFTAHIIAAHPAMQAVEWVPRIAAHQRPFYERHTGSILTLKESGGQHNLSPAPAQGEYFPITYLQPPQGNERALGFDISSNPTVNKTLQTAIDSGQTTLTERIHLIQDLVKKNGIVIYTPIYAPHQRVETPAQRHQQLRGFVGSVLLITNEINDIRSQFDHLQLSLKIIDGQTELFNNQSENLASELDFQRLEKTLPLRVANHQWTVVYSASPQFYNDQLSWNIWWLIFIGFLLTGLSGTGLLMLTGRTLRTEDIIGVRTRELEAEIVGRKKIIRQRNDHNEVLQAIVSAVPLDDVLALIVAIAERDCPDSLCSILLLDDKSQRLYLGAAPNLPAFYNQAVEGLPIGEGQGSCGTAAFTGKRVVVEDIQHHAYWREFAALAQQAGLGSCWSAPIFSSKETVLGTFAIYHAECGSPKPVLLNEINELAQLASIAIEKKQAEERISQLAFFDPLTDLPNRRLFFDRMEQVLVKSLSHHTTGALLYLDLDHFKTLNDSLGHAIGDELLVQVAHRLKSCLRDEDSVARLGGDEFVILFNGLEISEAAMLVHAIVLAEAVQAALRLPYHLNGYIHHITPSIGITLLPQLGVTAGELLKQADTAMYHAKQRGRNAISFYDEDMQRRADQRLILENDLCLALSEQQFSLYYQPQFNNNGELIGAEALLRWLHPKKGLISPVDFIPVAEESSLILAIGEWVLNEGCRQLQAWPQLPHLAINICPKEFHQPQFTANIINILNRYALLAPRLMLEITEGIIIDNINESIDKLSILKELGVAISIDDFGTGYSSLSYLKVLPISQLKIDQSFINDINADANSTIIVETIIDMAKHLGLSVLAEGVETADQWQFLKAKGCDGYQGYFFSKPLSNDEFAQTFLGADNRQD